MPIQTTPNVTGPQSWRPIELTRKVGSKQFPIFVNPDRIACFGLTIDRFDNEDTSISFESGWTITVAETPEQIIGLLAKQTVGREP